MKWLYLPWKYKSADTATKLLNMVLYVMGCLLILGIILTGYYMMHIHTLSAKEHQVVTHRATQTVPVNVDHRRYNYIYHTDKSTYESAERTIQSVINTVNKHDISSSTDRIYWLRKYISDEELNDESNPLIGHNLSLKHGFIGFDTTDHDQKALKFVVKADETDSNGGTNNQSASSIITGNFDGTTHKITSLSSLDDGQ